MTLHEPPYPDTPGFQVKDSGERREFPTGARRDMAEGKLRPSWMLSVYTQIRLACHMTLGAIKYGPRNYEKGIPDSSFWDSLEGHLLAAKAGLTDEDHLAAAMFNLNGLITNEEGIKGGLLPESLHDMPQYPGAQDLYWERKAAVQSAVDAKRGAPDKEQVPSLLNKEVGTATFTITSGGPHRIPGETTIVGGSGNRHF